jgi:hypothetical protein
VPLRVCAVPSEQSSECAATFSAEPGATFPAVARRPPGKLVTRSGPQFRFQNRTRRFRSVLLQPQRNRQQTREIGLHRPIKMPVLPGRLALQLCLVPSSESGLDLGYRNRQPESYSCTNDSFRLLTRKSPCEVFGTNTAFSASRPLFNFNGEANNAGAGRQMSIENPLLGSAAQPRRTAQARITSGNCIQADRPTNSARIRINTQLGSPSTRWSAEPKLSVARGRAFPRV